MRYIDELKQKPYIKGHFDAHNLKTVHESNALKAYEFSNGTGNYRMNIILHGYNIFVSGDLGEWVFDCSWKTAEQGLPSINSQDADYLLGKLSRNCKKHRFNNEKFDVDMKALCAEICRYFEENYDGEELEEKLDSLTEIFDDLDYVDVDEYRVIPVLDDLFDKLEDLTGQNWNDEGQYFSAGEVVQSQLECVLVGLEEARTQYVKNMEELKK